VIMPYIKSDELFTLINSSKTFSSITVPYRKKFSSLTDMVKKSCDRKIRY
jgi:hypothetical protein